MEDVLSGKKKLEQLKVAELRDLLEQRGLSKAGIKLDLVKRLREAISKEDSMQPEKTTEDQNEGRNEASNSAEDAETEESAGSQLDQASSQSARAKEVSSVEQTAAEPYESEELAYEGESDVEKSAGRVARGEREGTPLQDENGEKGKTNKEDADNKEPDPVIDLHVSEPMDMEEIDEDVAPEMEKSSAQTQEVAEPKKEVEQLSPSTEPHELLLERFTSSSRRHLWVSGTGGSLSKAIKAIDLKDFFSKYGQVVSASIVAPKSRYYPPKMYGFVTMKTEKEAELCIRELNLREVKGQKLLIEIAKNPPRVAPVDTYVDPSKASDASSPLTAEKSQGQKESDSSDTVSAALDRSNEGPDSDVASGNPEGENQSGSMDIDREKKRGSPRGHDQNRNRQRDSPPKRRSSPISRRLGDNRPRDRRPSPRRARSRSPPRLNRRSPPIRRRSPRGRSPPRGDLRRGLMAERRHVSDGRGPPFDVGNRGILPDPPPPPPPPPARGSMGRFEGRLEPRPEPRMESRMDPRPDIIVRTQNELFQRELAIQRHEKQLAQQMKMVRDREMKEKEMLLDQERRMREKEREILDRERRDRQLRDELERELKHKAIREKELIERERKELEEKQRILREKEDRMEQERQQKQMSLEAKERELKERERQMLVQQSHSLYSMHQSHAMATGMGQKRPYSAETSEYGMKRAAPSRLSSSPYMQTMGLKTGLSGPSASASSTSWGDAGYGYGHTQETKKMTGSGGGGYPSTASSGGNARSYYLQSGNSVPVRSPPESAYGGFQHHEMSAHRSTPFASQKQSVTPAWRSQPPAMSSASSGAPRGYSMQGRPMGGMPSGGNSLLGMGSPTNRGRPSPSQAAPSSHMTARYHPPSREGGTLRSPYQQSSQGGRPY